MTIRLRTIFIGFLAVILCWFLYIERSILTPFIAAAIFAYIFNPVVNFFSRKLKFPRSISILIIYVFMVALVILGGFAITSRVMEESSELRSFLIHLLTKTKDQLSGLPSWMQPTVYDFLRTLSKSRFLGFLQTPGSLLPFFSNAISRIISFFIFIFSSYYFLKDGSSIFDNFVKYVPNYLKVDIEILIRKINSVLGGYLRGQVLLIFLMTLFTFIFLSIIGLKFAFVVAIFSGFAEIVPIFGPITAGGVAVLVELLTGSANFGLTSTNAAIIIVIVYFILRQLEDYFIVPHVMGKITKLHPFVIFFAVITGGHLWGILGLVLAVPAAAIIRLLLEFFLDQINGKKEEEKVVLGSE